MVVMEADSMADVFFELELDKDRKPLMVVRLPLGDVPLPAPGPITNQLVADAKSKVSEALPEGWKEELEKLADIRRATVAEISKATADFEKAELGLQQAWDELAGVEVHRKLEKARAAAKETHDTALARLGQVEQRLRNHRNQAEQALEATARNLYRGYQLPGMEKAEAVMDSLRSIARENGEELARVGMVLQCCAGIFQRGTSGLGVAVVSELMGEATSGRPETIPGPKSLPPLTADQITRVTTWAAE